MTRSTKHVAIKLAFICVSFLFCSPTFSTEWERIPKTNWANSMGHSEYGMCIEILPDNILMINLSIGMATPDIESHTNLAIEYDFGGYSSGVWPIANHDLVSTDINGYQGYAASRMFIIDLDPLCTQSNPPDSMNPEVFEYTINLRTILTGGALDFYPVLTEPLVFPDYMFPEITDSGYIPSYEGKKDLCCIDYPNNVRQEMVTQDNNAKVEMKKERALGIPEQEKVQHLPLQSMEKYTGFAKVFPNPVTKNMLVEIELNGSDYFQIDLININGKIIKSIYRNINGSGIYQEPIDMSDISPGVYCCKISSASESQTVKVIKI